MDRRRIQVSVDGRTAVFGPGLPEIVVGRQAGCFIRPDGAGVGGPAVDGSVLQEGATRKTGVCPLCGSRVRLGGGARLLDHTAAATAES